LGANPLGYVGSNSGGAYSGCISPSLERGLYPELACTGVKQAVERASYRCCTASFSQADDSGNGHGQPIDYVESPPEAADDLAQHPDGEPAQPRARLDEPRVDASNSLQIPVFSCDESAAGP
jgi:hypothetical protein